LWRWEVRLNALTGVEGEGEKSNSLKTLGVTNKKMGRGEGLSSIEEGTGNIRGAIKKSQGGCGSLTLVISGPP